MGVNSDHTLVNGQCRSNVHTRFRNPQDFAVEALVCTVPSAGIGHQTYRALALFMIERAPLLNDRPQSGSVLAAGNGGDWAYAEWPRWEEKQTDRFGQILT